MRTGGDNVSIKAQMQRMLVLMGILFVVLCLLINHSIQELLVRNAAEHTEITSEKLENQLEIQYRKTEAFCMDFAGSKELQEFLRAPFRRKSGKIYPVVRKIAYYEIMDPSIKCISIVNGEIHYSSIYTNEQMDRLRKKNCGNMFSWLGVEKSGFISAWDEPSTLVYGYEVLEGGESIGTILFSINYSYFQINSENEMGSYYLLADDENILLPFNGGWQNAEQIWKAWKDEKEGKAKRNVKWAIQSRYLEEMDCWQISALDIRQVRKRTEAVGLLIWFCVALLVIFTLLLVWLINSHMVKPLQYFHGVMKGIRSQKKRGMKEKLKLGGCLEIRELGEEFTGMLQDIEGLNLQIFETATEFYEMKVQKQEAELAYMRSQIDPHFLYNTLEVFRRMALEKEAPEMAQMAVDMGNIFRYSIKGESIVPLEKEISIIKSYIRIQKNRFQGKMEVLYSFPVRTMQVPVMKMLLQPLVENAIYHGLEPKEGRGNLYIGARLEEGLLIIMIKDDGVGIDSVQLDDIREELEREAYDTSRHLGIVNTQVRIRLQYGRNYGIKIESQTGDGTTVTIRIPTG